jgi:hypothetical protein
MTENTGLEGLLEQTLMEASPLEGPIIGFNRHQKLMSPATRELVLKSRQTEIEAFANDRGLDPHVVGMVCEVAMRTGRVPDLRQYGFAGDEALAVKHFIGGEILNLAVEDIEQMERDALSEGKKKLHPEMHKHTDTAKFKAHVGDPKDKKKPFHKGKGLEAGRTFDKERGFVVEKMSFEEALWLVDNLAEQVVAEAKGGIYTDYMSPETYKKVSKLFLDAAGKILTANTLLGQRLPNHTWPVQLSKHLHSLLTAFMDKGNVHTANRMVEKMRAALGRKAEIPPASANPHDYARKHVKEGATFDKTRGFVGEGRSSPEVMQKFYDLMDQNSDVLFRLQDEPGKLTKRLIMLARSAGMTPLQALGPAVIHAAKYARKGKLKRKAQVKESELAEVSPPGFSGTTKAMKDRHPEIDNPYALAWSMYKKGAKPHKKPEADAQGVKQYMTPKKYAEKKKKEEAAMLGPDPVNEGTTSGGMGADPLAMGSAFIERPRQLFSINHWEKTKEENKAINADPYVGVDMEHQSGYTLADILAMDSQPQATPVQPMSEGTGLEGKGKKGSTPLAKKLKFSKKKITSPAEDPPGDFDTASGGTSSGDTDTHGRLKEMVFDKKLGFVLEMKGKTRKQKSKENKARFAKMTPEQKAATKGNKPFHSSHA